MTNEELIAKIKAEIEKQMKFYYEKEMKACDDSEQGDEDALWYQGHRKMCAKLLSFLSTLESEKPIDIDFEQELYKHFGQVKDFTLGMRIGKYFYELGKQSGSSEKPMNQDEFSKEFDEYFLPKNREQKGRWGFADIFSLARHFAQWGAERQKEQMMKDAIKWLVDDDYDELTDKGRFILGSAGLGYNGYYIPYSDLLKLPKEDEQ